MSFIRTLMGRREFLAAGVASTCALTCKKAVALEAAAAVASSHAAAAATPHAVGNRCSHLLAPLAIRDRVLRNRIVYCVSGLFAFQGPERYPSEAYRNHFSNVAKNAALVTVVTQFGKYPKNFHDRKDFDIWGWEHNSSNKWEDIPPTWNYVDRMLEDIHAEGSLAVFGSNTGDIGDIVMAGEVVSESGRGGLGNVGVDLSKMFASGGPTGAGGAGSGGPGGGGGPRQKSAEDIVADAKDKENLGYDAYYLTSSNPKVVEAVRNATGMVLLATYTGGSQGDGYPIMNGKLVPSKDEIEKAVETARKLEGLADIFFMKGSATGGASWERPKYIEGPAYYIAEAIKKAGINIKVCMGFGLFDPIKNNEYIAKGITDMVGMTRPLIADTDLVAKLSAGLADEVVPCTQCQNCHWETMTGSFHLSRCQVNPAWQTSAYKLKSITPPLTKKKVAVIGGGPAGMKAALVAAERGHKVTLYEKEAALGGLQRYTEHSDWVWTYKIYKDYLISMLKKRGIEVKLNTNAVPAAIKAAGYDTVLVAVGAEVTKSKLAGGNAGNVFDIMSCYSRKNELGQDVVVVGAGKLGVEAALSMALDGRKVTVLSANDEMIEPPDIGPHSATPQTKLYRTLPNYKFFLNTTVTDITGGKVTFKDKNGAMQSVQADSIVLWDGLKPRADEAASFTGSAPEVLVLGDCNGQNGRIISATRNAFLVASRV
jgi:NADPH-dependent 2,4-dienoyl-CoA reductase/sulfur reductase-like enzyme